ncbi:MAG: LysM peptidoglycan-binding domain-containing protein [Chloroflexota bacterium]
MNKRPSASARTAAVTALVVAAVVVIVAVGAALNGGGSGSERQGRSETTLHKVEKRNVPATYEVQSGDTLISIAHRTGVPVRTIEQLNPHVDPQILIAGEVLKLR